jgi:threonine synthase
VPVAVGDFLILDAIRESDGTAVAVADEDIVAARDELAATEGTLVSLEAAATLAGYRQALAAGSIAADEETVLFFTGSGLLDELEPSPPAGVVEPGDADAADRRLRELTG